MVKDVFNKRAVGLALAAIILIILFPRIHAAASFAVNSFSCTPSEVVVNNVFSCTAQIINSGDVAGSVSIATLYSDGSWLEDSSYVQASGTSVNPGQTTEVTFTGLRAVSSGNNGFSKIMLDDVTDTYVADQNVKENVINVVVIVSNSASSAAMGDTFDSAAEVTAGGNIDVELTFTINSGGCSIGSQTNPKTISGMSNGNSQSRTWTVTQGSSGNCRYTVSASATGTGGVASKTDSTISTVTCTDCPEDSGSSSSSSSGGGGSSSGGGGGSTKIYIIESLNTPQTVEVARGEKVQFTVLSENHTMTLLSVNETDVKISVESSTQTFIFNVGDYAHVDFNNDELADVSIKLKSINLITSKVVFIFSIPSEPTEATKSEEEKSGGAGEGDEEISRGKLWLWILIAVLIIIAIISGYFAFNKNRRYHGY